MATPKKPVYQERPAGQGTLKQPQPVCEKTAQLTYDYLVMMLLEKSETLGADIDALMTRLARVSHPEAADPIASVSTPDIADALQPLAAVVDRFEGMIQRVRQLQQRLQI